MLLRCNSPRILALNLFLSISFCSAFARAGSAAPAQHDLIRTVNLPIEQWLDQGERTEIPWKVSLSHPLLTYQLRNLVRVTAEMPVDLLQKQGVLHDLHFIVKAAPEHGAWDPEESYSRFRVEARLDPRSELQMLAELYLQPGAYTIATIAYDATLGKRNLSLTRVQVEDPDQGLFPQLLSLLPKIQFLPPPDNAAPLGAGRVFLPIATQRPVQFDLIVDLSTRQDDVGSVDLRAYPPNPSYPMNSEWPFPDPRTRMASDKGSNREVYEQSRLLQVASLLSAMDLKQGCIAVAVFDILRHRTILPLTSAGNVKWGKLRDEILSPDRAMVSVADLKGRRDAAKFFQQELEQTMAQPPSCRLDSPKPLQVIAILSRGLNFPAGGDKPKMQPRCDCKIFYLQKSDREGYGGADLKNMLKPLSRMTFEFANPQDFRQKLLEFTRAVERLP